MGAVWLTQASSPTLQELRPEDLMLHCFYRVWKSSQSEDLQLSTLKSELYHLLPCLKPPSVSSFVKWAISK